MDKAISVDVAQVKVRIEIIEHELEIAKKTLSQGDTVGFESFLRSSRFVHSASRLVDAPARS